MDSMDDLVVNAATTSPTESESKSKSQKQDRPTSSLARSSDAWHTDNTPGKNPLHVASPPILNPFNILSGLVPNNSSNKSINGRNKKDSAVSVSDIEATKYNHDLEQARMMQQGLTRKKQQQKQQRDPKELTESDIRLGLDGLDQADDLRSRGRVREALKVSELALELLIRFLRSDPSAIKTEISRDTVEARVLVALSSAEEMKAELEKRGGGEGAVDGGSSSPPAAAAAASAVNALSNSLKVALGRGGDVAATAATPTISSPSLATAKSSTRQAAGQTTSSLLGAGRNTSVVRGNASSKSTLATNKNKVRKQGQSKVATASVSKGASHLLNSQDPLVQTVKSELYIDPSQLQSTTWDDIAGLDEAKQALQEAAILPLLRPDLFSGLRRPRNIILYGPPGTGKTMLVKAIAHESKCLLFICTASSLTSKWHGEGEKLLRTLFEVARQAAPSIIFVDEMDALLSKRKTDGEHEASRRFKTEFLTQMDGIVKKKGGSGDDVEKNLLVIGATNTPWDIDDAVLRRFPRRIYIPLPDATTRTALLSKLLENGDVSNHRLTKSDTKAIVRRLSGFSGSDISSIASDASFGPIRSLGGLDAIRGASSSDIRPIERQDFDHAIDAATKSVSKNLLKQYENWKIEQQAAS
jgi:SpoVK/Ycf46/Vps4 family AAA+-type ATPase